MIKNPFIRFLIIGSILYVTWYLLHHFSIGPNTNLDHYLSLFLAHSSSYLFHFFGYTSEITEGGQMVIIAIKGTYSHGVWIGEPCNGLALFALFTIFIIAYPGPLLKKIWYIPLGILLIHIVNMVRIMILTIIARDAPETLDFNHNYTFTITVYSFVFLLWYIWVTKLSKISSQ